jgi:hypothetical protein
MYTSAQELAAIASMVTIAEREHLAAEVVWSYGNARSAGEEVLEAIATALDHWIK